MAENVNKYTKARNLQWLKWNTWAAYVSIFIYFHEFVISAIAFHMYTHKIVVFSVFVAFSAVKQNKKQKINNNSI